MDVGSDLAMESSTRLSQTVPAYALALSCNRIKPNSLHGTWRCTWRAKTISVVQEEFGHILRQDRALQ